MEFEWKGICELMVKDVFWLARRFEVVNNLQASFDMISKAWIYNTKSPLVLPFCILSLSFFLFLFLFLSVSY